MYVIRIDAPGLFTFLRPDGTAIPAVAPQPDGDGKAVEENNRRLGLELTELTGIPDWDGHPPDYSWAIEVLHRVSAEAPAATDGLA